MNTKNRGKITIQEFQQRRIQPNLTQSQPNLMQSKPDQTDNQSVLGTHNDSKNAFRHNEALYTSVTRYVGGRQPIHVTTRVHQHKRSEHLPFGLCKSGLHRLSVRSSREDMLRSKDSDTLKARRAIRSGPR